MHQRDMSVSSGTRLLEIQLEFQRALLRSLVITIATVDVIGDDAVAQSLHGGEYVATCRKIRWAHVCGLHANHIDQCLLETRHLAGEVRGRHGAKVLRVTPGLRCALMTGLVGVLQGGRLAVDTAYILQNKLCGA